MLVVGKYHEKSKRLSKNSIMEKSYQEIHSIWLHSEWEHFLFEPKDILWRRSKA